MGPNCLASVDILRTQMGPKNVNGKLRFCELALCLQIRLGLEKVGIATSLDLDLRRMRR